MTLKSTNTMVQPSITKDLVMGFMCASNALCRSSIIGSISADVRIQPSEYPELDALSMLDAAMKVFLAKRLASK